MATVKELLRNPLFKNATPEAQSQVIKALGLTSQDVFALQESDYTPTNEESQGYISSVSAIPAPEEPGVLTKLGRAAGRGVAQLGTQLKDISAGYALEQQYGDTPSIYGREATTGLEKTLAAPANAVANAYTNTAEYYGSKGEKYLEENPSLVKPTDNTATRWVSGALESAPTSLAYMAPQAIPGIGGGLSTTGMALAQTKQAFDEMTKELDTKGIPYDPKEIYKLAVNRGAYEAGTETASDIISLGAASLFTKGIKAASGKELIDNLFGSKIKAGLKALPMTLGTSAIGETSTEVANLYGQEGERVKAGLENRFGKQWVDTFGTALLMSVAMGGGAQTIESVQQASENDKIKNVIFNGLESPEKYTPEQLQKYFVARYETAQALVPTIEESLGKEAADNFINNIKAATAIAVTPTEADTGNLPLNESIFTATPSFDMVVLTSTSSDIVVGTSNTAKGGFDVNQAILDAQQEDKPKSAIPQAEPLTSPNIEQQREQATGIPSLTGTQSVMQQQMEQEEQVASEEQQMIAEQQAQREEQAKQEALQIEAKDSITGMSVKQTDSTYRPIINKDGSVQIRIARNGGNVVSLTKRMTPVEAKDFMEARAEEAEVLYKTNEEQSKQQESKKTSTPVQQTTPKVQPVTPVVQQQPLITSTPIKASAPKAPVQKTSASKALVPMAPTETVVVKTHTNIDNKIAEQEVEMSPFEAVQHYKEQLEVLGDLLKCVSKGVR